MDYWMGMVYATYIIKSLIPLHSTRNTWENFLCRVMIRIFHHTNIIIPKLTISHWKHDWGAIMDLENCPKCNNPLEKGEIGAGHWIIWAKKLKWYSSAFAGERITMKPFQTAHIPAFRCTHCRMIIFDYWNQPYTGLSELTCWFREPSGYHIPSSLYMGLWPKMRGGQKTTIIPLARAIIRISFLAKPNNE